MRRKVDKLTLARCVYVGIVVVIGLFTISPCISVGLAGSIAAICGCKLDEGSTHPCIINGRDYGETLYRMGVAGWFFLITLPAGPVIFASFWLLTSSLRRILWLKLPARPTGDRNKVEG